MHNVNGQGARAPSKRKSLEERRILYVSFFDVYVDAAPRLQEVRRMGQICCYGADTKV
jgi:hypothetical protein